MPDFKTKAERVTIRRAQVSYEDPIDDESYYLTLRENEMSVGERFLLAIEGPHAPFEGEEVDLTLADLVAIKRAIVALGLDEDDDD